MGTQIGELFVKIGADVTSFTKGITTAGDGLKGFSARLKSDIESGNLSIQSLGANMLKAAGPAGVMAGAVAGLGVAAALAGKKIYDFTMEVEKGKDNLADLASEAGLSMETISGLQLVAMKSGMTIDELAGSFKFLGKAVMAAGDETSKQAETFRSLGISLKDASGNTKSSIDLFKEIATVLSKMPDGFRKSTIEMELFGRSGVKLNEILMKGGEVLDAEIKRGIELANVTKEDADAAQKLIDANAELTLAWRGMKNELSGGLTPALTESLKYMTYFIEESRNAGEVWAMVGKNIEDGKESWTSQIAIVYRLAQAAKFLYLNLTPIGPLLKYINGPKGNKPGGAGRGWEVDPTGSEDEIEDLLNVPEVPETPKPPKDGEGGTAKKSAEEQAAADMGMTLEEYRRYQTAQNMVDNDRTGGADVYEAGAAADANADLYGGLEEAESEHQLKMQDIIKSSLTDIEKMKQVSWRKQILDENTALGAMAANLRGNLTTIFGENKAFNMAMGLIDAYKAIMSSYKFGASVGGPALGAAMAGVAAAAQFKILSDMNSVQPGSGKGGGKGGGGGYGGGAVASAPSAALPSSASAGGTATINIVGGDSATFSGKQVRELIERVNDELDKGMKLRVM